MEKPRSYDFIAVQLLPNCCKLLDLERRAMLKPVTTEMRTVKQRLNQKHKQIVNRLKCLLEFALTNIVHPGQLFYRRVSLENVSRYSLSVGRAVGGSATGDCTLSTLGSTREGRGALGAGGGWLLFSTALPGTKPSGCLKTGISGLLDAPSTGLMMGDGGSALL